MKGHSDEITLLPRNDEMARLAAACDTRWCSQAPQDDEITRLAAACDRRRRSEIPRDTTRWPKLPKDVPRDGSRWSKLPKDVLDEVICRLPSLGARHRLAAVCHHWLAAERQHLPYSLPKLCLALPNGSFFTFQPGYSSVWKPRDVRLSCGSYCGASNSQLLCDTDVPGGLYTLANPFTQRKRRLPVPSGIRIREEDEPAPEEGYFSEEMPVRKLVVCPDGGLVAAIVGHECSARVALCVPEVAWSWSLSAGENTWRWYADMVFFDGKLYALTNDEDLLALEVGYDDETGQPRISDVEHVIDGAACSYALQEYTGMRYLVVRPGGQGLLMVCRIMLDHGSKTHEFAVFQADLPSSQWVQVDNLGGYETLFVGRLCSGSVRADRHGLPGDQIFFLDDFAGMEGPGVPLCDGLANVYDMKDGSISELLPARSHGNGGVPPTWLFHEDIDMEDVDVEE